MSRARGRVAVGLMMAACNHGSKASAPGCCDRPQPAKLDAGRKEARVVHPESGAPAPAMTAARFRKEEGCSRDFKGRGEPSQDLLELARLCGQGMAPFLTEVFTPVNGVVEVPLRITSPGCFRGAAMAGQPGLTMTLLDPLGSALAMSSSADSFVLVPTDGTLCVREAGDYRTTVRVSDARDPHPTAGVTIQIWQASRD